jgi:hypothetical protein
MEVLLPLGVVTTRSDGGALHFPDRAAASEL